MNTKHDRLPQDPNRRPGEQAADQQEQVKLSWFSTDTDMIPVIWKVGDIINNRYHVTEILGEGGMGTVYKIYDDLMNTDMAVKSPSSLSERTEQQPCQLLR